MAKRLNIKDSVQQWIDKINAVLDLQNVDGSFVSDETSWDDTTFTLTGGNVRSGTSILDVPGDSIALPIDSVNIVGVDTGAISLTSYVEGSVPVEDFIPLFVVTTNNERITGSQDVRTWAYEDSGSALSVMDDHTSEDDPHPQYATDQDLTDHVNAADPHSQYTLESDLADSSNAALGSALVGHRGSDVRSELDRRVIYVDTLAELQALDTSELVDIQMIRIATSGRAGEFVVRLGDFSTEVANDPQSGVWVAFDDDPDGSGIVAMRRYSRWGGLSVGWFGSTEGVSDDTAAVQAAVDYGYANRIGDVWLDAQNRVTSIDLKAGVVLNGNAGSADIGDGATPSNRAGLYSRLIQIDGTNAAAVRHLHTDYDGSGTVGVDDKARGLGLRNVLIVPETEALTSATNHPMGVLLESCAFVVYDKVLISGFYQNVVLEDVFDTTFYDMRITGGLDGLVIRNRGDIDNSNNLIFMHPRIETWKRTGVKILSGADAPYRNNKIEFYHLKNEGLPDSNGVDGITIVGGTQIRFFGGYTSIKPDSTPPSTFTLARLSASESQIRDTAFIAHGLATNGVTNTINSMIKLVTGGRSMEGIELDFALALRGGETLANGIFDIKAGSYENIDINIRDLVNPDAVTMFNGLSELPAKEVRVTDQFKRRLTNSTVYAESGPASTFIERGDTGNSWELRHDNGGDLQLLVNNSLVARWIAANGNMQLSGNQLQQVEAATLTPQSAPPGAVAGTMASADGAGWDPAGKGSGPYPVFYTGSAWLAMT